MSDFLASLGFFGWSILCLALFGIVTLPRALRELMSRPWKASARTDRQPESTGSDGPEDTP